MTDDGDADAVERLADAAAAIQQLSPEDQEALRALVDEKAERQYELEQANPDSDEKLRRLIDADPLDLLDDGRETLAQLRTIGSSRFALLALIHTIVEDEGATNALFAAVVLAEQPPLAARPPEIDELHDRWQQRVRDREGTASSPDERGDA